MLASPLFVITALGLTQIIFWGTIVYGITVLAKPMGVALGWSQTFIFFGFSLSLLVGGLAAKPVARFLERHGGRVTMAMGSVVAALGLALMSQIAEPVVYLAAWVILGLASRLTLYDAAFATLVEYYGLGARRPISILALFGGLASTVYWPICFYVEAAYGWRVAWLVCAASVLVLCTPLLVLLPRKGADLAARNGNGGTGEDPAPLVDAAGRSTAILLLAFAFACNSFITVALNAHFIPAAIMLGASAATAVWIASIRGVFQTLGRLAEMMFGKNLDPFHFAILSVGLLVLAFLALAAGGASTVGLLGFSILFGMSIGLVTIVRGTVPLVLFGRQGYAGVLATIAAPGLMVTAAAPTAYAWILDTIGPRWGFAILFVLALASLSATIALAWRFRARST
jgi:hypothetical protein